MYDEDDDEWVIIINDDNNNNNNKLCNMDIFTSCIFSKSAVIVVQYWYMWLIKIII